jgi:signal transduction histidine kinase
LRGLRTRLLLAVVVVVILAFGGSIFGFNLLLGSRLSSDADNVLRARAAAELSSIDIKNGHITAPEAPENAELDSVTWVYSGFRELEHPRARPEIDQAARSLAGGPRRTFEVPKYDIRLYGAPVSSAGKRIGTVVSGVSLAPYERTQHLALIASLILAGLLLVLVALVAQWMVTLALRPVVQMTAQAEDWSEHDLDRRFALGEPHDELTTLAATLDGLLARISASLRHEQNFSSEMSHELRTPLAKIKAEAELALRRPREDPGYREALQSVLESVDQISRTIDALLAAAREEASAKRGTADGYEAAIRASKSCSQVAERSDVAVTIDPPATPVRVAADEDLVERILIPVLENACRYGRTSTRISISTHDSVVRFDVVDDGPGVTPEESSRLFEPGVRGTAAAAGRNSDGAGLGLSLARRLARAAGGHVEVHPDSAGGHFRVVLPSV